MWKVLLFTWFVGICSSVVSCPHHCECYLEEKGLHTANCSGSALTTALLHPNHSHPHIDILNIRPHFKAFRTKLSPNGFVSFKNIKFLNLSNTSVDNLPNEVFHGLNYIITIDLSFNKIKRLNGGVFKELSTLQTLLLRGNPLILTSTDVIVSKSLRKLDLGNCGLRNIYPFTFGHVPSLTALFLDGNSLQTIEYNTIPSGVSYLNLANNLIVNVPTNVLQSMRSLNRIDLSGNPVRCTCLLLLLQDTFSGQGRIFENDIVCSSPRQFLGQKLSSVNENYLCNLEFKKKDRYMNTIKHFRDVRSFRKHNMIKPPAYDDNFGIQGDQPRDMTMSDELTPTHHETETMFSNDETISMGTHMAAKSFTPHYPNPLDISDENNKLPLGEQNLPATASTEVEVISNEEEEEEAEAEEEDDPPEELNLLNEDTIGTENDDVVNTVDTGNSSKHNAHHKEHESVEGFNENESSPMMDQEVSSTEKTEEEKVVTVSEQVKHDKSSIVLSSTESHEYLVDKENTDSPSVVSPSNHTEHSDDLHSVQEMPSEITESEEDISEITESSMTHEVEELSSSLSHNYTNEVLSRQIDIEHKNTSEADEDEGTSFSSSLDDVEDLTSGSHNFTNEPSLSRYSHIEHGNTSEHDDTSISSIDEIFKTEPFTTSRPGIEPYTWPTSITDMTDYSYDAQHDDYSSVEPWMNALNTTDDAPLENSNIPLTTEMYTSPEKSTSEQTISSSVSYSFETEEEGSGEASNETLSEEEKATVPWMEEQENETTTEDYSIESISSAFNTSDESELSRYVSENVSSTDITVFTEDTTTEMPTEFVGLSNETESEEEISVESSSPTEESTTEEIMTTVETTSEDTTTPEEVTSEETTVASADNETQSVTTKEEEETTYFTTEETTVETIISVEEGSSSTESSSTVSNVSSSSSYNIEVTSENVTESSATSEETATYVTETSTSSSPIPLFIPEESEEEKKDEVPSTSEAPIISEHSVVIVEEHSSTSESYDSSSNTPVSEVEFVSKSVHVDDKENIILDPTKEEISKTEEKTEGPDIVMIGTVSIIILIILIIIIISMAVVCRRTKRPKNKIRLPADPEANLGTEMQDMLLPKPPENGVKVVPKNYTNGTTGANGNKPEQKEEETPVLAAEPEAPIQEPDWEEKPEPIETVTARLSMLARPQTPVFIPKTVN